MFLDIEDMTVEIIFLKLKVVMQYILLLNYVYFFI